MKGFAILFGLSCLICLSTQSAQALDAESAAAIAEDTENAISIVNEAGIDASSEEGCEVATALVGASCNNSRPEKRTGICWLWGHPVPCTYTACPTPSIPCSQGKSCQVTRSGRGCSCQPIPKSADTADAPAEEGSAQ